MRPTIVCKLYNMVGSIPVVVVMCHLIKQQGIRSHSFTSLFFINNFIMV